MKAILLAALPCLLLAACGRQEPVGDVPSSEDLANAANAAAASAADNASQEAAEAAENRNYVNNPHGFSITMPEGWVRDATTSNDDGVVFKDPGAGADIRVFWSKNVGNRDLKQVVEAMNTGSEAVEGDFLEDREYRGSANDGEGNSVAVRMVRKADGSLVTATFVFPEMLSEQYLAIGNKTLDTLRIFDPVAPAGVAPAPANNATAR